MKQLIQQNLSLVRGEIERAERAAGREGKTLMLAAIKYADAQAVQALLSCGVRDVGENRVQQLLERYEMLREAGVRIHFIGSLQTNKVKYIVDKVDMIHSVDSPRLAAEIERRAAAIGRTVDVLVEINSAREEAKTGVMPEGAEELCRAVLELPHLKLRGFMTMGAPGGDEAAQHRDFSLTHRVGDAVWRALQLPDAPLYSMGMSGSFAAAIAEGADMIRVGRRLFT